MSVLTAIDQFDRRMVHATGRLHHRRFFWAVRAISRTGDGYIQIGCLLIAFSMDTPAAQAVFQVGLCAFAVERAIYVFAKRFFKRKRPADALSHFVAAVTPSDCFSFPSGHTMAAFLIATLLFQLIAAPVWLVYGWASAVGCSRVLVGVHFPSDILAGGLLGAGIAVITMAALL